MKTLQQHIIEEKQSIKESRKKIKRYEKEIEIYKNLIADEEYHIKFTKDLIKSWKKKYSLNDIYEDDEGNIQ